MALASIAATLGAGASIFGAVNSAQAAKQARQSAEQYQSTVADQLAAQQEALQGLFDNQEAPADIFASIFGELPGLLDDVLPSLREQSITTANEFTDSNISTYQKALHALYPDFDRLQKDQVTQIDNLNPANLGSEEIAAKTRLLGPLVPAGTLNPNTPGAVAGGTTNPVSLYRNLISGMYDQRRTEFLNADNQFLTTASNAATRQQERASSFFLPLVNDAFGAASSLTGMTNQQQQGNIQAQAGMVNTLLGLPPASFNPLPYAGAVTQGITGGVNSLAALAQALKSSGGGGTVPTSAYAGSLNVPGHSVSEQPLQIKALLG